MKLDSLPRKPQYIRVELDADMIDEGPKADGSWPGRERVLTYHYFGERKLRAGDRVCVCGGLFTDVFGTVLGKSRRYGGYSFRVRRARLKTIEVEKTVTVDVKVEVA